MPDVPDRVLLYHMTHYTNFAQILHEGAILCINRVHRHFVDIAYPALRNRRRHHPVPVGAKGTLADYVPFYFAPRSPMLYAIHQGLVPGYTGDQHEIVYLVVPLQSILEMGLPFVFTDGHPVNVLTRYFDAIEHLKEVDWEVVRSKTWHNTPDDPDRRRRRQAEFLVYEQVPVRAIERIVVYDRPMVDYVCDCFAQAGIQRFATVEVKRDYYYPPRKRNASE